MAKTNASVRTVETRVQVYGKGLSSLIQNAQKAFLYTLDANGLWKGVSGNVVESEEGFPKIWTDIRVEGEDYRDLIENISNTFLRFIKAKGVYFESKHHRYHQAYPVNVGGRGTIKITMSGNMITIPNPDIIFNYIHVDEIIGNRDLGYKANISFCV